MGAPRPLLDDLIAKERACGVAFGPFWRAKYLDRAPEHIARSLARARRPIWAIRNSMDTPVNLSFPPADFTPPVTAGVETALWDSATWTSVAAEDPEPGSVYLVAFGGVYGNRTTSSPASTWTPRWGTTTGGVALGASAAVYSGAALTTAPFYGELTVGFRSSGTSATAVAEGYVVRGTGAPGAGTIIQTMGGTLATVDTTAAGGLFIGHTWSATNASNTLTVQWVYLKKLS